TSPSSASTGARRPRASRRSSSARRTPARRRPSPGSSASSKGSVADVASIIRLPEVMANATEAVIATWVAPEGATVAVGDVLAEIETEKAVVEMNAEQAGVIAKHLVAAGTLVRVGAPVALLLESADEAYDLDELIGDDGSASVDTAPAAGTAEPQARTEVPSLAPTAEPLASETTAAAAPATAASASRGGRVFASPLARKIAREAGVAVEDLEGTGPGGRIVRRDVERHLADAPSAVSPRAQSVPAPSSAGAPQAAFAAAGEEL